MNRDLLFKEHGLLYEDAARRLDQYRNNDREKAKQAASDMTLHMHAMFTLATFNKPTSAAPLVSYSTDLVEPMPARITLTEEPTVCQAML